MVEAAVSSRYCHDCGVGHLVGACVSVPLPANAKVMTDAELAAYRERCKKQEARKAELCRMDAYCFECGGDGRVSSFGGSIQCCACDGTGERRTIGRVLVTSPTFPCIVCGSRVCAAGVKWCWLCEPKQVKDADEPASDCSGQCGQYSPTENWVCVERLGHSSAHASGDTFWPQECSRCSIGVCSEHQPPDARIEALIADCMALRKENTELLAENARLRRKLETKR